ncbi:hypothetical protein ACO0RG_004744 [Hanseniaspora osmophila]
MEPQLKKAKVGQSDEREKDAYRGYTIPGYAKGDGSQREKSDYKVDVVSMNDILNLGEDSSRWFYNNYIRLRKPCKITGCESSKDIAQLYEILGRENILENFKNNTNQELLDVEKEVDGGFGSGKKRLAMTFSEFWGNIANKETKDTLYLTTQYKNDPYLDEKEESDKDDEEGDEEDDEEGDEEDDEEDDDEEEDQQGDLFPLGSDISDAESISFDPAKDDYVDSDAECGADGSESDKTEEYLQRMAELYQRPLTFIADKISPNLTSITDTLLTQQINVWIGSTKNNTYKNAEFFQKLLDNTKTGTSHSTSNALGKHVPGNKLSSGLHHDHADNIYLPVEGTKQFTVYPPNTVFDMYTVGDIKNVYSNGVINYVRNEKAPSWNDLKEDGTINDECELYESKDLEHKNFAVVPDPPSFSKINPVYLHLDELRSENKSLYTALLQKGKEEFSKFFAHNLHKANNKLVITLNKGDALYLPSGWFHEVSSIGDLHIALNYWFTPPTINPTSSDDYSNLYSDELYSNNKENMVARDWYIQQTKD